jgi:hypothetical protein
MLSKPSTYLKALYGGVVAFLGALVTVMVGDVGVGDVTQGQWLVAVLAGLTAGGGVYKVTNQQVTDVP